MGLYDSFEYLIHKLWPKEKSIIKVPIWFLTIKVGNRFNLLVHRWHATYSWKAFDKGYNFSLNFTSIIGLHKKLWAFQVTRVPILRILRISRLSTWELWDKLTFGCNLVLNHREYYKREATKSKPWWILWVHVCL